MGTLPVVALALLVGGLSPGRALAATPAQHPGKPHHRAIPPSEITLTHTLSGPTAQVTMPPVGLSLEYPTMAQDLGTGACPPAALVAELRRLGSPPLSLAGASQDLTAPAGALSSQPPSWEAASLYSLPASFWSQLHCLLSAAGDPLTVGLNMKTGQLSWAQQMVAGAQSAATNGLDFSLGNEPDLYSLPNYASLSRPQGNEEAIAVNRYLQQGAYLQQALGGAAVIGPELAIAGRWRHELPRIIGQLHEQTVGVHLYPLTACGSAPTATIDELLSANAANKPRSLAWVVTVANAAKVPAIISESNSASCGGEAGVSDSPAAAVWAVRFVLSALKTGFKEVRFHSSGGPYDPFIVHGNEVLARPLQSALVALNQWLPVGATLQTVAGVRGLLATAIGASASGPQLILDNETSKPQTIVLRGAPSVRLEVLSPAAAGLQSAQVSSPSGSIKLVVASNSVLAAMSSP
jgi:hypothetical protein